MDSKQKSSRKEQILIAVCVGVAIVLALAAYLATREPPLEWPQSGMAKLAPAPQTPRGEIVQNGVDVLEARLNASEFEYYVSWAEECFNQPLRLPLYKEYVPELSHWNSLRDMIADANRDFSQGGSSFPLTMLSMADRTQTESYYRGFDYEGNRVTISLSESGTYLTVASPKEEASELGKYHPATPTPAPSATPAPTLDTSSLVEGIRPEYRTQADELSAEIFKLVTFEEVFMKQDLLLEWMDLESMALTDEETAYYNELESQFSDDCETHLIMLRMANPS